MSGIRYLVFLQLHINAIRFFNHPAKQAVVVANRLQRKNIVIDGRRTSMRLEESMWVAVHEICEREGTTLNELCSSVSRQRGTGSLTSAMRVHILKYYRDLAHGSESRR